MSKLEFSVSIPKIYRASFFATTDELKVSLLGVWVERAEVRGVLIMATDGDAMCIIHDPSGYCPPEGVCLNITDQYPWEKYGTKKKYVDSRLEKMVDDDFYLVSKNRKGEMDPSQWSKYHVELDTDYVLKEGRWKNVLPAFELLKPAGLNHEYLSVDLRLIDKIKAVYPEGERFPIRFWCDPDFNSGAFLVEASKYSDSLFVVMPMQDSLAEMNSMVSQGELAKEIKERWDKR